LNKTLSEITTRYSNLRKLQLKKFISPDEREITKKGEWEKPKD
jgi:hypothetical protein